MNRDKFGKFAASLKARIVYGLNVLWFYTKVATAVAVLMVGAFAYGTGLFTNEAYAENVTTAMAQKEAMAPVLARIADCESGSGKKGTGHQFNSDGTIVHHINSNGTTDVGMWEINMNADNIAIMVKYNFNVLTEDGNHAMAAWLYENVGTDPWNSSKACWK